MFLDSHDLYAVVAVFCHARQYVVFELAIGAHLLLFLAHAHMAFVDKQWVGIWLELLHLCLIRLGWIPYLCTEYLGDIILHHSGSPCRDALSFTAIPLYLQFKEVFMMKSV